MRRSSASRAPRVLHLVRGGASASEGAARIARGVAVAGRAGVGSTCVGGPAGVRRAAPEAQRTRAPLRVRCRLRRAAHRATRRGGHVVRFARGAQACEKSAPTPPRRARRVVDGTASVLGCQLAPRDRE
jgi:hypothetical protein